MPLRNADVAAVIDRLGDLYELDGAVVYRVAAYRRAAERIRTTGESVDRLAAEGRLTELADVGATIAEKIEELRTTGRMAALERLERRYPAGLVEIMRLPGVGPRSTRRLWEALGVTSLADLREACAAGRVREVPGFGAKGEARMLAAIDAGAAPRKAPILIDRALERAADLLAVLQGHPACLAASEAGSLRRRRETVGDLDLVASSTDAPALLAAFAGGEQVAEVLARGDTRVGVLTHDGLQVDLRVVPPEAYGNLLQHMTGSKAHNVALREEAQRRGLSVSEWGVTDEETGDLARHADEAALYAALGYAWIPPELREGRGELEAARAGALPALLEPDAIRGDLHAHTIASDGKATVAAMAEAARARGYAYLAITDHSAGVGMGIGLEAEEVLAHAAHVREVAAPLAAEGFHLLAGIEVDVLADGALDLPDDVLAGLDWVVASLHGGQRQGRDRITGRLLAAAEHPHVDVIGHPSGRMFGRRDGYEFDVERVVAACAEHGTFLEVNANPRRLDLRPEHVRLAIEGGVRIVVSTDAHRTSTLDLMRYGVAIARRGWATADDVANTRDWPAFQALRKPGRG